MAHLAVGLAGWGLSTVGWLVLEVLGRGWIRLLTPPVQGKSKIAKASVIPTDIIINKNKILCQYKIVSTV